MIVAQSLQRLRTALTEGYGRVGQRWDDLPERLERDFDRRALVPRFLVLLVLGAAAFLDYGHGHRLGHWIVLLVYGLTTVALALSAKASAAAARRGAWLPLAATVADAGLTVYVIADHLPQDANDALHATDAVSLMPAFLLLLQTGLRLRRDLVVLFSGIVVAGWAVSLSVVIGWDALLATEDAGAASPASIATRQALGLLSFAAAAGFVLYAVHRMRIASSDVLRAQLDRMLLSRFLPESVAAEVVRGDEGAVGVAERHACLLAFDLKGFSAFARERPSAEVIADLMGFRRIVHDAVSANGGIVDKYIGDGVLALLLEGEPRQQAERAVAAVQSVMDQIDTWNGRRAARPSGVGPVRAIAALHHGPVLAGVFDDGRRAEFTVLGPAMNALARLERRAKEEDVDFLASSSALGLLSLSTLAALKLRGLPRRTQDDREGLPDVAAVSFGTRRTSVVRVRQPNLASPTG